MKDKNSTEYDATVSCEAITPVQESKSTTAIMKQRIETMDASQYYQKMDKPDSDQYIEIDNRDVEYILNSQTALQRLGYMFVCDINGSPSFESRVIKYMPVGVFGIITMVNMYLKAPEYAEEFIKKHKATAWPTKVVAKRKFNDFVLSKSFAFGCKRGFKIAFLSTSFLLLQWSLYAYRGKSSWWETSFSCATVGALYCFGRGFKGMVAGSVIGGIPGLTIGPAVHWLQTTHGMTYQDINRRKVIDYLKEKKNIEEAMRS